MRVEGFVIGLRASFNCHNLILDRCFFVNNLNAQVYAHDLENATVVNNVIVGGEYGLVLQRVSEIRAYHNTIFIDGQALLGDTAKAGAVIQGERLFGLTNDPKLY